MRISLYPYLTSFSHIVTESYLLEKLEQLVVHDHASRHKDKAQDNVEHTHLSQFVVGKGQVSSLELFTQLVHNYQNSPLLFWFNNLKMARWELKDSRLEHEIKPCSQMSFPVVCKRLLGPCFERPFSFRSSWQRGKYRWFWWVPAFSLEPKGRKWLLEWSETQTNGVIWIRIKLGTYTNLGHILFVQTCIEQLRSNFLDLWLTRLFPWRI